jgi:fructan beta-fructosidase
MRVLLCLVTLLCFTSAANSQSISYNEKYRPQFHFSPPAHWMNDPNGMVYYKGEYHLFYQYYPDSTVWGPMHWGHAVSKDLIHWQHLPIALYPDSLGYIFSGSAVVDKNNSTGFQTGTEKPLVAIYTYHDIKGEKAGNNNFQTQGIAYSLDKGRNWKKYNKNPVIKNTGDRDFRDPKLSWHEASKHWIVTLAVGNKVEFYRSENLKDWELSGSFGIEDGNHGGVWECPDLIEIKTPGSNKSKWVLFVSVGTGAPNGGSGTQYFVGNFDGKTFTNNNPKQTVLWVDYGCDNYAGITWSNAPDNQHLFLGWMSNWQYAQQVPTSPWRSAMTLPRILSLQQTPEGLRLRTKPAPETASLRKGSPVDFLSKKEHNFSLCELSVSFDVSKNSGNNSGIEILNSRNEKVVIGFDQTKNQFYIDRTQSGNTAFSKVFAGVAFAPRISKNTIVNMHLFIDRSSVEFFADDGSVVMTELFFPTENFTIIRPIPGKESNQPISGKLYALKSAWH